MAHPGAGQAPKKGKKNRKHGRNKRFCEVYRMTNKRQRNKERKVRRHLKRHPNDRVAKRVLEVGK